MFQWSFSGVQRFLKEVQWVFEGSFKGVSRMFKEVLRVFQGRLRGDSREVQGYQKEVQRIF